MSTNPIKRVQLEITGQVQGVGFRPFVYRLAVAAELTGFVLNDASGVTIEIQGPAGACEQFLADLNEQLPPLAQIMRCRQTDLNLVDGETRFEIKPSVGGEFTDAQVTVDTATCSDCLKELADPADPRYRYPFINCTNCGPRYSIIQQIPYDRPGTTMSEFEMCPLCRSEYEDPASRRFHAQPVACPACGPVVWLTDTKGMRIESGDPIATAAEFLKDGKIVAIKGLGGFHLGCRADDEHAVGRLRRRKRRDAKPFAVMVAGLDEARRLCEVTEAAAELLAGAVRPIVILPKRTDAAVAPSVAAGLNTLGVMLAYTPLHQLLMGFDTGPLVMTSGNYSDEPLVTDNDSAVANLGQIADALLLHNRKIERPLDDSVVQLHTDGTLCAIRRARGYAPQPIQMAQPSAGEPKAPAILAVGAELKGAFCLFKDGRAVLSEHMGDLKGGPTYRHFIDQIARLTELFDVQPGLIVCDKHPMYLSSEYASSWARGELAGRDAVKLLTVQHHHAHIASCLAENGLTGPAIGLACDGVGYGEDGAIWGCEVLVADVKQYSRVGHLRYLPLPGGDAAALDTYRPAVGALFEAFGPEAGQIAADCKLPASTEQIASAIAQLQRNVNCPLTSSLGRWFDAVAGLTGVAVRNGYEGQAPMLLEAGISPGVDESYDFVIDGAGPFTIDLRPMVKGIVADKTVGIAAGVIATKFHNTVAAFLFASARRVRQETGLSKVALSGGCFANRYLTARLVDQLTDDGFEVLRHRVIPCNDGGVALGQAIIAAAQVSFIDRLSTGSDD